ncbi:capsular biosynthesis protein [archaeon]|nr:capsular biosynthesis protein [archaeon]MBT3730433.1 capsular biosynthesis protein [archaeon]MBT4670416.1 capsular biosynthesis protein [archaeon]MBT5030119.1 capsular biosynthesis protein [archaeon]MBT5288190.1 capsular biosynthesis protein [archaeon]
MIAEGKVLVIDLDGVLCKIKSSEQEYSDLEPIPEVIERIKLYKKEGFHIIINTSRNMRTYKGNLGKINANTLKTIFQWLDHHNIPYDEIHIGKPWCGKEGFYIDDKAIRPSEFLNKSYDEIKEILDGEKL